MAYTWTITVPCNTQQDKPCADWLQLAHGTIVQVSIIFPSGCGWLVGCRFLYHDRIVFPFSPDTWYTANNYVISFNPQFDVIDKPYGLSIEAYNLDDTYQHRIGVIIGMEFEGGVLSWFKQLWLGK